MNKEDKKKIIKEIKDELKNKLEKENNDLKKENEDNINRKCGIHISNY